MSLALLDYDVDEIPEFETDEIAVETNFYQVTERNEVIFPRWDKISFSNFWWNYYQDDHKREILCIGRGGGKSWNVAFKKVCRAFENYQEIKRSGIRYTGAQWHLMIICPSEENYKALREMLTEMIPKVPGYAPDGNLNYRYRGGKKSDWRLFGDNELLITLLSSYSSAFLRGKYADDLWLDEASLIKKSDVEDVLIQIIQRQGRPPQGRFFTISSTPDATEKLLDPWFDDACEQANPARPDRKGFFTKFHLYEGSWLVNALISDGLYQDILEERKLNEQKFDRERMGRRGIIIDMYANADGSVGNFLYMNMLQPCFYREAITPLKTEIYIDLAFGTRDSLCRLFWCDASKAVYALDIFSAKDTQLLINGRDPIQGIVDFIVDTSKQYPSAEIIYDANGEYASAVERLLPRHIRAKGIKKNGASKNALVDTFEKVLGLVENGENKVFRMPHPDAPFLTEKQAANFRTLVAQIINYRRVAEFDKDNVNVKKIRYTKVSPFGDDALDTVLLRMGRMKALADPNRKTLSAARRAAGR